MTFFEISNIEISNQKKNPEQPPFRHPGELKTMAKSEIN
jgi:hypothetical protein